MWFCSVKPSPRPTITASPLVGRGLALAVAAHGAANSPLMNEGAERPEEVFTHKMGTLFFTEQKTAAKACLRRTNIPPDQSLSNFERANIAIPLHLRCIRLYSPKRFGISHIQMSQRDPNIDPVHLPQHPVPKQPSLGLIYMDHILTVNEKPWLRIRAGRRQSGQAPVAHPVGQKYPQGPAC